MKIYTFKPGMLRGRLPQKILLIMRLVIIIMITGLMQVSAAGFAQRLTYAKKNTTLAQVFTEIKKQTGYNVLYSDQKVDGRRKLSVDFQNTALEEVLDVLLKDQELGYEIDQKTILIKVKTPSFVDKVVAYFVNVDVRGRVVDAASGEGLSGANVKVKGVDLSVSTDGAGDFLLHNVSADAVLEISYIGYITTTVTARKDVGTIRLEMATSDLQEVRINKGYYTEKKELSTGSVGSVSAKIIEQQPVNNPLLALQGRVPGLFIEQTSGIAGSKMNVNIRGKNSLQNGIDPLYIVDGVMFSSQSLSGVSSAPQYRGEGGDPFYALSTTDIESIEILKDADATAIYGSRGANGVILITTKRGKQGKPKINLNGSTGISKVPHFLDLMNTEQYLQMRHQGYKNDNVPIDPYDYSINGTWDTTRYTNWQKEFLGGSAQNTILQASVSGGSQTTTYLFSGSSQKETSIFPTKSDMKKGSFLFSVSNESPSEKLKSRFSSHYVTNSNDMAGGDLTGVAMSLAPNAPSLYDQNGRLNWENSTWTNPIAGHQNRKQNFKSYNLITNASIGYEILPRLEIKANLGLNHVKRDERAIDLHTANDPAFGLTPSFSRVFVTTASNQSWIVEPQISWTSKVESFNKFSVIFGGTFQNQITQGRSNTYRGFASNSLVDNLGSATTVTNGGTSNSVYRYSAAFARINYTFRDKYIVNLTGRRDGSSRFGPGKQFANLGAVGGAWIFSKENFAKSISFLNFGKLRSSFGITGNDQIGDYRYLDSYSSYPTYNGGSGLVPVRLFNPSYAWETTRKYEAALELGFLNGRLNITSAYYNNRSSNQLIEYRVGSTTGFTSVLKNFPAKIENSGFELDINTVNSLNKVRWTSSFNISFPRNKLVEFEGLEASSYASTYVVGKSLSVSKRYNYTGIDPVTGIYTFEDMNGDGAITPADRLFEQELSTKFFGGLNNSFSYQGLSVDIFFQFVSKNAPSLYQAFYFPPGLAFNQPVSVLNNAWTVKKTDSHFQRFSATNNDVYNAHQNYLGSTKGYVDASFIRLKNVSLSYKLPKKWIAGIESSLFIQGQNLFTLTGYDGLDPETGPGFRLPTLRTIVIGGSIKL